MKSLIVYAGTFGFVLLVGCGGASGPEVEADGTSNPASAMTTLSAGDRGVILLAQAGGLGRTYSSKSPEGMRLDGQGVPRRSGSEPGTDAEAKLLPQTTPPSQKRGSGDLAVGTQRAIAATSGKGAGNGQGPLSTVVDVDGYRIDGDSVVAAPPDATASQIQRRRQMNPAALP